MAQLVTQLVALVVLSVILYFGWRFVRNYIVKSPLDKIPGPPPASIISGVYYMYLHCSFYRPISGICNREHVPNFQP